VRILPVKIERQGVQMIVIGLRISAGARLTDCRGFSDRITLSFLILVGIPRRDTSSLLLAISAGLVRRVRTVRRAVRSVNTLRVRNQHLWPREERKCLVVGFLQVSKRKEWFYHWNLYNLWV
jgi:hypothetical protein